jgi:hypothetical protein
MRIPQKTILVTGAASGMAQDGFAGKWQHRELRKGSGFAGRVSVQRNLDGFFVR